jgi:hypothetical protein
MKILLWLAILVGLATVGYEHYYAFKHAQIIRYANRTSS